MATTILGIGPPTASTNYPGHWQIGYVVTKFEWFDSPDVESGICFLQDVEVVTFLAILNILKDWSGQESEGDKFIEIGGAVISTQLFNPSLNEAGLFYFLPHTRTDQPVARIGSIDDEDLISVRTDDYRLNIYTHFKPEVALNPELFKSIDKISFVECESDFADSTHG